MIQIKMTIITDSWYDDPEETYHEQSLMEHAVREGLDAHGFGDAIIGIELVE